jgi:hypothetical protein
MTRRDVMKALAASAAVPAAAMQADGLKIRHVDIIHHTHTDFGYTDMPSVVRDLQVRYLDAALQICLDDQRFRWTMEGTVALDDWWRGAPAARRSDLLRMVHSGQMDVMAMGFNQTPFLNALEWRQALDWLPPDLLRAVNPQAAMQNDVNGFPRAGAMLLLDRGIRRLVMGINPDSGGPPFQRPSAFWWKMPDGRRLFVWLGDHYGTAYGYFEKDWWQRGQARAADATLGPPRAGDFLRTDPASLRACQSHLHERLHKLEAGGYAHDRLIVSFTNAWRWDNDVPFPPLSAFVEAWNALGLTPALRLVTATQAVLDMERAAGDAIPTLEGEWTDWWANGDASGPRELAASRAAKRNIAAALAPVWGQQTPHVAQKISAMLKDLCLYDEHTFGANISVSEPYSLFTIAQYDEKSLTAYRPMGHSEWLLGQRARVRLAAEPAGLYVVNTAREPYSGWVTLQAAAIRDGTKVPNAGDMARFWVEGLAPNTIRHMQREELESPDPAPAGKPEVPTNSDGWPVSASWPDMQAPLFAGGLGDFLAVTVVPPADRGTIERMHGTADQQERERMRAAAFLHIPASYGTTRLEPTAHTLVYTQPVLHPRLDRATRRLELWRREPRARLTVRFDRLSSRAPEVFYLNFAFPVEHVMPVFSNGGVPFTPYEDQLKGTCRDYYAIDSWARYKASQGEWLWVTRDAALVTVGGPHTLQRRTTAPPDTNRILAMIFDNFWHTNFVANSRGTMEFQFELAWRKQISDPDVMAEALLSTPVVAINPAGPVSPELMKSLFTP